MSRRTRKILNQMTREASSLGLYDITMEEDIAAIKESRRRHANEPEVKKVYPVPKDRPVNKKLISEITKGQKPRKG